MDRVDFVGADIIEAPERRVTAGPVRSLRDIADFLAGHAFAFVTGTSVGWSIPRPRAVDYPLLVRCDPDGWCRGKSAGRPISTSLDTAGTRTELSDYALPSVRGPIRMVVTDSFETELPFGEFTTGLARYRVRVRAKGSGVSSSSVTPPYESLHRSWQWYLDEKALGSIAQLILVSEQLGQDDRADALEAMLKGRMEKWFRGEGGFYFGFHKNVGALWDTRRNISAHRV